MVLKGTNHIDVIETDVMAAEKKQAWNRTSDNDRLMLETAVRFGLSGNAAAQVVNMEYCNPARILREQAQERKQGNAQLSETKIRQKRQDEMAAELMALMKVSNARELGLIKKRNWKKIDQKVNESVSRYIAEKGPQFTMTLPEHIAKRSKKNKLNRTLPAIPLVWNHLVTQVPSITRTHLNWLSLPADIREEEKESMRDFLFSQSN